jgi:hypothetical protein
MSIERFFGRVLVLFRLQRPPVFGWSAVETRVALTSAAVWVIALAAWQAARIAFAPHAWFWLTCGRERSEEAPAPFE